MVESWTLATVTMFGAIVGSFLNVVIHRLPARDVQRSRGPRSACPHCGAPIPGWLNIPILSWLLLRGRARCCKVPISARYPLVEAITAGLFFLLAWIPPTGVRPSFLEPDLAGWSAFLFGGFLVASLVANTFIDLEFRILPDRLTKPTMAVGILAGLLVPAMPGPIASEGLERLPDLTGGLLASLLGMLAGLIVTWSVRALGSLAFGREAMGLGDVKLMGGIGAFLGWQGALLTFFLGCVLGALGGGVRQLVTRDPKVAFGPFLAGAALISLFFRGFLIEFLTVTWPEWTARGDTAPLVFIGLGVVLLSMLLLLRRRRYSR